MIFKPSKLHEIPKVFIVVSKFNEFITEKLLKGAIEIFHKNDVTEEFYSIAYVPGAFEIPIVIREIVHYKKPDGIVAIACIIKGETEHYYFLADSVIKKILNISVEYKTPITNAIIVCNDEKQALDRAGGAVGNRGAEAAQTLLNTISIISQIKPL